MQTDSPEILIKKINEFITSKTENIHGVIVSSNIIETIKNSCNETEFCKILSYQDSQGFEFESTLVVISHTIPPTEIERNLEYIALTRAMNEMQIIQL